MALAVIRVRDGGTVQEPPPPTFRYARWCAVLSPTAAGSLFGCWNRAHGEPHPHLRPFGRVPRTPVWSHRENAETSPGPLAGPWSSSWHTSNPFRFPRSAGTGFG